MIRLTSDNDLEILAKKLNIQLDGVITIEEAIADMKRNGRYIILLHDGNSIGHWVCFDRGYYFDSFGQPPPRGLLKYIRGYNRKQFQAIEQNFCGQWCLLALYSRQKINLNCLIKWMIWITVSSLQ